VLTPVPEGCRLDYTAQASVAGKLGQIGGRLMDASAKQLSARFFAAFKANITEGSTLPALAPTVPMSVPAGSGDFPVGLRAGGVAPGTSAPGWFDNEKSRLLWFVAGVASTALGVWMGAHWLR